MTCLCRPRKSVGGPDPIQRQEAETKENVRDLERFFLMRFVKPVSLNPFVKLIKILHLFYVIEFRLGSLTNLCYVCPTASCMWLLQSLCACCSPFWLCSSFSHVPLMSNMWEWSLSTCPMTRPNALCISMSLITHDTSDVFKSVTVYLLQEEMQEIPFKKIQLSFQGVIWCIFKDNYFVCLV